MNGKGLGRRFSKRKGCICVVRNGYKPLKSPEVAITMLLDFVWLRKGVEGIDESIIEL